VFIFCVVGWLVGWLLLLVVVVVVVNGRLLFLEEERKRKVSFLLFGPTRID